MSHLDEASADRGPIVARQGIRAPRVSELIAAELRRSILRGDLNGSMDSQSELDLVERFGVSRPTLREALRVLEAERLISIHRGSSGGIRVHPPSGEVAASYTALVLQSRGTTLQDVYDTRAILEVPCARILAERNSSEDCSCLRDKLDWVRGMENEPELAIHRHMAFHDLLVDLSGIQTLALLHGMLRNIVDRMNLRHTSADAGTPRNERALRKGFRAHERLVELIGEGRSDEAEALWKLHLAESDVYMLSEARGSTVVDLLE